MLSVIMQDMTLEEIWEYGKRLINERGSKEEIRPDEDVMYVQDHPVLKRWHKGYWYCCPM
jgi:hypothetical protein